MIKAMIAFTSRKPNNEYGGVLQFYEDVAKAKEVFSIMSACRSYQDLHIIYL